MTITITITLMVTVSLPVGARVGGSQKGALRVLMPVKGAGSRNRRCRYE
jgi:hypothetical protein